MAGALLLVTGGGVALGSGPAVAAAAQPNARVPAGCAATAAAGLARIGRIGGIARPAVVRCATRVMSSQASGRSEPPVEGSAPPLQYYGGPVMSVPSVGGKVVVTPIFWSPAGYAFADSYKQLLVRYLDDVAADSGAFDNVFATNTEYAGKNGRVHYGLEVAPAITDTRPFPTQQCTTDSGPVYSDGSGYSTCLDDDQVSAEVRHVVRTKSMSRDLGHMYVVFTPKGVESCFYSDAQAKHGGNECTVNASGSGTSAYCAYHSYVPSRPNEIYAEMPFPIYDVGPAADSCGSETTLGAVESPNGNPDADVEISPLSHEMSEAITDPNLNAWTDANGYENGDECAYVYGATRGTAGRLYNQTINGHHYLTQEEFSNNDFFAKGGIHGTGGCVAGEPAPVLERLVSTAGATAGRDRVMILGRHLFGVRRVYFGAARARRVSVVNDHKIVATTPAHRAGSVAVSVTTPGGTSNAGRFTYLRRPVVSKISKPAGPHSARRWVELSGRYFVRGSTVLFGRTGAPRVRFVSPTELRVLAPRHKRGIVGVFVADAGGRSGARRAARYTYR
ncbi:MAG TPA: IPT/TIG domain-containing protein [Jatrophihabitans sp.]|nr:IPT/TIG domain-containing protein [Jatrophihabitans sp.]